MRILYRISLFTLVLGLFSISAVPLLARGTFGNGPAHDSSEEQVNQHSRLAEIHMPELWECTDRDFALTLSGKLEWERVASSAPDSVCLNFCAVETPSLDQCTDLNWINSICGRIETQKIDALNQLLAEEPHPSICVQLAKTEGNSANPGIAKSHVSDVQWMSSGGPIHLPELNAQISGVQVLPYQHDDVNYSGMVNSTYGDHMNAVTELSKDSPNSQYATFRSFAHSLWQQNGPDSNGYKVENCTEYVYEKYYDFSHFEYVIESYGNDYRKIFDTAYGLVGDGSAAIGQSGIAGDPLSQWDGTALEPQIVFPKPCSEITDQDDPTTAMYCSTPIKNIFFALAPWTQSQEGPTRSELKQRAAEQANSYIGGRPVMKEILILDDDIDARLRTGRALQNLPGESWQWHSDMNIAMQDAGFLDEQLFAMDQVKEDFARLLWHRAQLRRGIKDYWDNYFKAHEPDPFQPAINGMSAEEMMAPIVNDPVSQVLGRQAGQRAQTYSAHAPMDVSSNPFGMAAIVSQMPEYNFTFTMQAQSDSARQGQNSMSWHNNTTDGIRAADDVNWGAAAGAHFNIDCSYFDGDILRQMQCELAHTEADIEAALINARELGCLKTDGISPCDWSPKMFYEHIQDYYSVYREPDLVRCNEQAAKRGSFSNLTSYGDFTVEDSVVHTDETGDCASTDWGASPSELDRYFACYDAWVAATIAEFRRSMSDEGTLYNSGKFGKTYGASQNIGGDMFGANFSIASSWEVSGLSPTNEHDYCGLQPDFAGSFDAEAKAMWVDIPLIHADAGLSFTTGKAQANLRILDQSIFHKEGTLSNEKFNIVEGGEAIDKTLFQASTSFVVVIVPVTIRGGAAGQLGLTASVGGGLLEGAEGCSGGYLGSQASFTPYAGVDAFASASVNLVIAEAGIKATLNLVRIEFPLTAQIKLEPDNRGDMQLNLHSQLDFVTSVLSGRLAAFVEICYVFDCDRFEKTIFSWDGPHWRKNIYKNDFNLAIVPINSWLSSYGDNN